MLKNADALNDALNIIIEAFENRIIESEYHPDLVVGNDLSNNRESDLLPASDSNNYESHGFTDRELQMFSKYFSYKNPKELRQALIEATDEKYNDLLKDFILN